HSTMLDNYMPPNSDDDYDDYDYEGEGDSSRQQTTTAVDTGQPQPRYHRILLKLSGEALAGDVGLGIDPHVVTSIADQIKEVVDRGGQGALGGGGGNIGRGWAAAPEGMDRSTADYMGMLATVLNALARQDALEKRKVFTRVQSPSAMHEVAEP